MAEREVTLEQLEELTADKDYVPTASGLAEGARGDQVKQLQRYLDNFGYFKTDRLEQFGVPIEQAPAPPPERSGTFDDNTAQALRTLQEQHGLQPTACRPLRRLDGPERDCVRTRCHDQRDLEGPTRELTGPASTGNDHVSSGTTPGTDCGAYILVGH